MGGWWVRGRCAGRAVALLGAFAAGGACHAEAQGMPGVAPGRNGPADEVRQSGGSTVSEGQGGVGGTGLGKMPPAGDAPGTGNSVKGPAGQGITAPTVLQK